MTTRRSFHVESFFQALADTTRLRLLNLLSDQELCVCHLVDVLRQPQPKVSRHLAYLRRAGIVASRREGKWMHYRIVEPPHAGATQILAQTLLWLSRDRAMQSDRARLAKAGCQVLPVPPRARSTSRSARASQTRPPVRSSEKRR